MRRALVEQAQRLNARRVKLEQRQRDPGQRDRPSTKRG